MAFGCSRVCGGIALLGMVIGIGACASHERAAAPAAVTLGVAGQANEDASIASAGDWVALAWSTSSDATGTNVVASVSNDGGRTFGNPVRVNAVDRQAAISGEQPPRIALVPRQGSPPDIVVVWTARLAEGTALLSARSHDGGRSFGSSELVPGAAAAGNRGWQSIATDAAGHVHAAWLDHRDTVDRTGEGAAMHHHGGATAATAPVEAGDGVARAQLSQLFVGGVDGTAPPRSVARGVCYCCKTALLATADGSLYAAWRHVYPGNERDIAFAASRDGGRSFTDPVRVSDDAWQIDGCPENGPSLSADRAGRVHVVWPTLVRDRGVETLKLFSASTSDGLTFSPRSPLPTSGAAYHPQLVGGADGKLYVAWDELAPGASRRVRVARGRSGPGGSVRFEQIAIGDDTAGAYPVVTATAEHLILAWTAHTAPAEIHVRLLSY